MIFFGKNRPPAITKLRGIFSFSGKNRLGQMKQDFEKSNGAKRANCNLKTRQTATLRAGLICNLRTRQIATLAAGAKAARFGALLVLHTPKKSTFGSRYTMPSRLLYRGAKDENFHFRGKNGENRAKIAQNRAFGGQKCHSKARFFIF